MRISKYPCMGGLGTDPHCVLPPQVPPTPPPPAVPLPIPSYPWIATLCNPASALIYGKFTNLVSTDFMADILMGHDWGILQPHMPTPPYTATPALAPVNFGASHKFFLPSFPNQETPTGGALSLIGASGTPVAISTPAFNVVVQDCIDVGGGPVGLVAPVGMSFQPISVRWVSFTLGDLLAGMISMAGDAVGAALTSSMGNAMTEGATSAVPGIVVGATLNTANSIFQNAVGSAGSSTDQQAMATVGILTCVGAPGGVGVLASQGANAVGNNSTLQGISLDF